MKLAKEFKKGMNLYIKQNIKRGNSLDEIKKSFITHGYNPDLAENLIKNHKIKNTFMVAAPLFLMLLLAISTILFYNSDITTFAILGEGYSFTDNIDLIFDQNADYLWSMENKGILKSVKLNGEVKINGTVKVYLQHENKTYLIFDNKQLEEEGLGGITGFVIEDIPITSEIKKGNLTEEEQIILDNLIKDINETKNNVEIEIEIEDNEAKKEVTGVLADAQELLLDTLINILVNKDEETEIKIKSEFPEIEEPEEIINDTPILNITLNITINVTPSINETNVTINQTINITPIINETEENISIISIDLEYEEGSIYDKNDDGLENIVSAIDLTVEDTEFNWDVNQENLCTVWDTYNVEQDESTLVCYGSSRCCSLLDLSPSRPDWNETFYVVYGQYGSDLNNMISAQVVYADFNLSFDNPFSEIYYSEWQNLTASFYQGFVRFEDICIESCILPNLNSTSYNLVIEINNSELILDSLIYEILVSEEDNYAPILLKNFTDIKFFSDESYAINLSEYFYDEDNDTLIFDYYNNTEINAVIINETATLSAGNFTGTTYLFFTADDSIDATVSNVFEIEVKKRRIGPFILKSLRNLVGLV